MSWFGSRSLLVSLVAAPLLLGAPTSGPAEESGNPPLSIPGKFMPLRSTGENSFTSVGIAPEPPADEMRAATPGISVNVIYHGFTPEARAAFQFAADIWAGKLFSPVGITIEAQWTDLGPGVVGEAATSRFVRDFPHTPREGSYYPVALANSLAGRDLAPDQPDINAEFNSTFNWYFGTDGKCPSGKTDLVSVVLHELGHGLGFTLPTELTAGVGAFGSVDAPATFALDAFIVNGSGQNLTRAFGNPSPDLGTQFTGNSLFLNGAATIAGAGGTNAKLYVPPSWHAGTSISHLDETTYPAGNANSLMTPYIGWAESIHEPGPITMGLFLDLGWTLRGARLITPVESRVSFSPAGFDVSVSAAGGAWPPYRRERRAWRLASNRRWHDLTIVGRKHGFRHPRNRRSVPRTRPRDGAGSQLMHQPTWKRMSRAAAVS